MCSKFFSSKIFQVLLFHPGMIQKETKVIQVHADGRCKHYTVPLTECSLSLLRMIVLSNWGKPALLLIFEGTYLNQKYYSSVFLSLLHSSHCPHQLFQSYLQRSRRQKRNLFVSMSYQTNSGHFQPSLTHAKNKTVIFVTVCCIYVCIFVSPVELCISKQVGAPSLMDTSD